MLVGSVSGKSLSQYLPQCLPRSRPLLPSPSPECMGEAGEGVRFPLQAPVTLSFQQNSSLPKRYAWIHVKFIHSFNKHALRIHYEPRPRIGAGGLTVGKDKNPFPRELTFSWF